MNNIEIKSYLLKNFRSKIRDSDELDAKIKRFTLGSLHSFVDLKSELKRIYYLDNQKTNLNIYYRDDEDELVELENDNDMKHAFNGKVLATKVYLILKENEVVARNVAQVTSAFILVISFD